MVRDASLTLFRVRGVPIRAHWTLALALPYLAVALSAEFQDMAELAGVRREQLALPALVWGLLLALGLFASIAIHELAHSLVAIRLGGRVRSILLMLLGGASRLAHLPRRPYDEAAIAAAGPVASLALGGALYVAQLGVAAGPPDLRMALFYLAAMNVVLGVFNLIPAFPMDGGRLLRAALAPRLSRRRATRIAAALGKLCAIGFGLLGLWSASLLVILSAVFVYVGAHAELERERIRDALDGLRLVDLLPPVRRPPPLVAADVPVSEALSRVRELDRQELVVIDAAGAPVAVLRASDLSRAPAGDPSAIAIGELAARLPVRHVVVPGDSSASEAIERAAEARATHVIVVDPAAARPGDPIGLVTAADVARTVALQTFANRAGANPPGAAPLAV
jgi:Zn-dependent protease/CBS domain-containing protein